MKTIELTGKIEKYYDGERETIKLIQEDGYKIDLVGRFKEAIENFPKANIQVSYYLADEFCTKEQIVKGFLKRLYGSVDAAYEGKSYQYSSWTSGIYYDTILTVGKHDFYEELQDEEGRFILIELNFK